MAPFQLFLNNVFAPQANKFEGSSLVQLTGVAIVIFTYAMWLNCCYK